MTILEESNVDRLLRVWPRTYKALAGDHTLFLRWDDILNRLERELAAGASIGRAIGADPRTRRMPRTRRETLKKLAQADLRAARVGDIGFLGVLCRQDLFPTAEDADTTITTPVGVRVPLFDEEAVRPRFVLAAPDFICHRKGSTGPYALDFADQLIAAGREVWIAQRNAELAADWVAACRQAVAECGEFILLLSPDAHEGRRVRGEVQLAMELGKRIFVIHLAPGLTTDRFDLGLRTDHQLEDWHADPDTGLALLVSALRGHPF